MRPILNGFEPDKIGLSIDYDGSSGPGLHDGDNAPPSEELLAFAHELLLEYPNTELHLYNGSLRNTRYINAANQISNDNGCCFQHLVIVVDTLKARHPEFAHRIHLEKVIAEDIDKGTAEGVHFNHGAAMTRAEKIRCAATFPPPETVWLDEFKNSLHYLQLHHLRNKGARSLFIFLDDRCDILDSAHHLFSHEHPHWVPNQTVFVLLQFAQRQFYNRWRYEPIFGQGIVDRRYPKTVKALKSPLCAELIRHNKSLRIELLPILNNPTLVLSELLVHRGFDELAKDIATLSTNQQNCYAALIHLALERNAKIWLQQHAFSHSINFAFVYKTQTLIEAAAQKKQWNVVAAIVHQKTDENNLESHNCALFAAIEASEITLATQIVKSLPPALRLMSLGGTGNTVLHYAIIKKEYALLEAALLNQDIGSEEFIDIYRNTFLTAFSRNDIDALKKIAPYSAAPENNIIFAISHNNYEIANMLIAITNPCIVSFKLELTLNSLCSLLEKNEFALANYLLLHCPDFTEKERDCFIKLLNHFADCHANKTSLTPALIQTVLNIAKSSEIPRSTMQQNLGKLLVLHESVLSQEMQDAIFVIAHNADTTTEKNTAILLDLLILGTLLKTPEGQKAINELQSIFNPDNGRWDEMTNLLIRQYLHYESLMKGTLKTCDAKKIAEAILSRLPQGKPDHIDIQAIDNTVRKMLLTTSAPNADYLKLITAHFRQETLRTNSACIAAHHAMRLVFATTIISDTASLLEALQRFENAPNNAVFRKTNKDIIDEFDTQQKAMSCAFFFAPTSYNRLVRALKSLTEHHMKEQEVAEPVAQCH